MQDIVCCLKCRYCGEETPLATSVEGKIWHAAPDRLGRFVRMHGDCYLLDKPLPDGEPFHLSYRAKKEPGAPGYAPLPMTPEQEAFLAELKRKRAEVS